MNASIYPQRRRRKGQVFVIYALLFPILFLFLGLGIDMALIFASKARLSRAVDATALRLTRKFENSQERRENIIKQYMKLNYPGFLSDGYDLETSGSLDTTETMLFRGRGPSSDDLLQIETHTAVDTGVVTVAIAGRATHRTFFMPIAGDGFRKIHFTGNASAERYPALNILILDHSGSMRGNNSMTNLVLGVGAFVEEFVDDRDYLLAVSYSTLAKVIWPNRPNDAGVFVPSRGFKSGDPTLAPHASGNVVSVLNQFLRAAGATNGSEPMRMAFDYVDRFLENLSPAARNLMRISYVYFTDGDINSFRSFARGVGYGVTPGPSALAPLTNATYERGPLPTDTGYSYVHTTTELPSFHFQLPVQASRLMNGQFVDLDGNPIIFTNYSGAPNVDYDLALNIASINPALMPGINATVQGFRVRARDWRTPYASTPPNASTAIRVGAVGQNMFYPSSNLWANRLYTGAVGSLPGTPIAAPTNLQKAREAFKLRHDPALIYPEPRIYTLSPGSPERPADTGNEYFPGGRYYSNFDPSFDPSNGQATNLGIYFERSASGDMFPQNGLTGNFESWNYAVTRISLFYPRYRFGGDVNYPPDTNSNGVMDDNDADWYDIGPPTHFYSFRTRSWQRCRAPGTAGSPTTGSDIPIIRECEWLTEAQGFVARTQHNATIYTILLGSGGNAGFLRRMSNDNNGAPFYPNQRMGRYYSTTQPQQLGVIFRDIANRIAIRLAG